MQTKPTTIIRILTASLLLLGLQMPAFSQSYTISPPPFLLAQNNSGAIINNACIWTYIAGSSTPATTYSDNTGTSNANPIRSDSAGRFTAFLVPGSSYKFVYESACTPPAHGTVLRTADNIAAMPASAANIDVTGTAGEALTAGQCAYLSDGSGSKNAGQWYKCDSTNAYSSTLPELGMVPTSISSAASGTIRLAGQVSGLTSLSIGSTYYASTAGTITATAPANRRALGVADSTSSLVLKDVPLVQAWANDFRLTLTTATPVTTANVTAATTLYCSPYLGNRIDLPDSAGNPMRVTSAEFSIAVPATTSTMYDVFAYSNSGAATLELLAWTNDTTRATAIIRTANGRYYKTGDLTRMYLGSFRTTAVSGQTEDSLTKRFLWNYYNRVPREMLVQESTASWTYSTATWRAANGGTTTNLVAFVLGVADTSVDAAVVHLVSGSAAGRSVATSIGLDSTSTPNANVLGSVWSTTVANYGLTLNASAKLYPAVGYHTLVWLEISASAVATQTWYGTGAGFEANVGAGGAMPGLRATIGG